MSESEAAIRRIIGWGSADCSVVAPQTSAHLCLCVCSQTPLTFRVFALIPSPQMDGDEHDHRPKDRNEPFIHMAGPPASSISVVAAASSSTHHAHRHAHDPGHTHHPSPTPHLIDQEIGELEDEADDETEAVSSHLCQTRAGESDRMVAGDTGLIGYVVETPGRWCFSRIRLSHLYCSTGPDKSVSAGSRVGVRVHQPVCQASAE